MAAAPARPAAVRRRPGAARGARCRSRPPAGEPDLRWLVLLALAARGRHLPVAGLRPDDARWSCRCCSAACSSVRVSCRGSWSSCWCRGRRAADPAARDHAAITGGVLRGHLLRRVHHPADLVPAQPPRRRRCPGRVDAGRPPGPHPGPGRDPGPAGRLARRVGAALGRRHALRRRLRRHRATASWRPARGRRRGRLGQGSGRGHAGAAAVRRPRRPARRRSRRRTSWPRPTTTSSSRTGRRGSPPPSTCRWTCAPATSRSARPATRPPPSEPPARAGGRCTRARARRWGWSSGAEFPSVHGTVRPGDAILLYTDGMVESRSRDIGLGTRPDARPGRELLRGSFEDGARRLIDQLGSRIDDRALLLIHRR